MNKRKNKREGGSRTWQFPLEQAEERDKKGRRRRRESVTALLKPLVHADIAPSKRKREREISVSE